MVTISGVTTKIILGLAAIFTAGIIVYKVVYDYFVGPRKALEDALRQLVEAKIKFYTEAVITQEGALSESQEQYLEKVNDQIDVFGKDLKEMGGDFTGILQLATVGLIGVAFTAVVLKYGGKIIQARNYVKTNITNVRTSAGFEALMRSAVNVSFAEVGRTSLAVAAQTSTEMWVSATLNPAMQAEITLLTAQIPALVGTQLMWAQFMVSSLQFQMMTAIPATMAASWALITRFVGF